MTPMINITEEVHTDHFAVQFSIYLPADSSPEEVERIRVIMHKNAEHAVDSLIDAVAQEDAGENDR